jgi:hypothetical protein
VVAPAVVVAVVVVVLAPAVVVAVVVVVVVVVNGDVNASLARRVKLYKLCNLADPVDPDPSTATSDRKRYSGTTSLKRE